MPLTQEYRECPSCALEVDAALDDCPHCGYEFPQRSSGLVWMALLFALLMLFPLIDWLLYLFN